MDDEQWARVNQVIERKRAEPAWRRPSCRCTGRSADTDFVRRGRHVIPTIPPRLRRRAANSHRGQGHDPARDAAGQGVVRSAQWPTPEMRSVLALFRRAANVLARLEDAVVFRGLA